MRPRDHLWRSSGRSRPRGPRHSRENAFGRIGRSRRIMHRRRSRPRRGRLDDRRSRPRNHRRHGRRHPGRRTLRYPARRGGHGSRGRGGDGVLFGRSSRSNRRRHRSRGRWIGSGCHRCGRRRRGRGRLRLGHGNGRRCHARRQEAKRVDVALGVGGLADAELDEWRFPAARIGDRRDHITLGDGRVLLDRDRAEMRERHRPPVCGLDRHRLAAAGHRAGEGDDAGPRRVHRFSRAPSEVYAPMLPRGIGARRIERERLQHLPVGGPGPGAGGRDGGERDEQNE